MFITDDGCSNGLNVEVDVETHGTVIDWTNDTVPLLGPGKKARLKFTGYQDYADQISIADRRCD